MKKKYLILIGLGIFIVIMAVVIVFYTIPYVKLNEWIVFVNKMDATNMIQDSEWVSSENFLKLRVVEKNNENEFVHLKTKKKIKFESFNKMTIQCDINAYTSLKGSNQIIDEYYGKKEIYFQYKNNKWRVVNIKSRTP